MSLLLLFAGGDGDPSPPGGSGVAVDFSSDASTGVFANFPYTPTFVVSVHEPLASGASPLESPLDTNSYSHTVSAIGGYDTATFELAANMVIINDWLVSGLMRHIVAHDPAGEIIWEGFVDQINLNFGRVSLTRGPVLGMANNVACKYTTVRYDPLGINFGGKPAVTDYFSDTDMQDIYGIIEGIVSAGEMHVDDAEEIARTHLAEFKYPETAHNVSFLGGSSPSITVTCKGYSYLLDKYTYSKVDTAAEINLSTKIQRAVEADPNSYFSVDELFFTENTLQVIEYEDGEKTARGLIDDLVARGDADDNRMLWGVYKGRKFQYYPAPVITDFAFNMSESQGIILDSQGELIQPWRVSPGHWLSVSDLMLGGRNASATDPRAIASSIFIESVSFTAPYGLDITGGRVSTLRQKLYRLGLGGMY